MKFLLSAAAALVIAAQTASAQVRPANRPPEIKHEPVTASVAGEPLVVRAVVTDDSGNVKFVTLHYSTSRDMAPFKLIMQGSGSGTYIGSIPAALLAGLSQVSYYIEALDTLDASAETPWYTVRLRVQTEAPRAVAPAAAPAPPEKSSFWKKAAWVTGGLALAGGAAYMLSDPGSDDEDRQPTVNTNYTGTYVGTVTTSFALSRASPQYETHGMTITIFANGLVTSDSLRLGESLEAPLVGDSFLMTATVSDSTNLVGEVRYNGTLVNSRITGAIEGEAMTGDGTPGVFAGTFYAVRQ